MIRIVPRRNESIQAMLRRFRKLLEKDGIVKEIKRREYYEKPSEERNRVKRKIKQEKEKELRGEVPPPVKDKKKVQRKPDTRTNTWD